MMVGRLFLFELRYWLRQPMVYIFLLINALLVFGAVTSHNVQIGGSIGAVYRNAPEVVYNFYGIMSFIGLLMVTAFVNGSAIRDIQYNTAQIVFSTPITRFQYLVGRFAGSTVVALLPMFGISLGIIVGSWMPWLDAERVGPNMLLPHVQGFLLFALPNVLFTAAVIFAVAVLMRNTMASFITAIVLIVGYSIAQSLMSDLDNETVAALLDPFGLNALDLTTKYWTISEKNTMLLPTNGLLFLNRLLWVAVSLVIFMVSYFRFSFHDRKQRARAMAKEAASPATSVVLPTPQRAFGAVARIKQFLHQVRLELKAVLTGPVFLIVMLLGLIQLFTSLTFVTELYDNTTYPVTYNVVDVIQGSLFIYVIIIVTFYTGAMIFREWDNGMNEIHHALPIPNWLDLLAKVTTMLVLLVVVLVVASLSGVVTQLINGYTLLEPRVYLFYLILPGVVNFGLLSVVALFIHTLVNNKYLGFFAFIVVVVLNIFLWRALDVESNLIILNGSSGLRYSDMSGFGPYVKGYLFFKTYWWSFGAVLLFLAFLFHVRGRETGFAQRLRTAGARLKKNRGLAILVVVAWIGLGGWGYYTTKVQNHYVTGDERKELAVRYEKEFKRFEGIPQPHYVHLEYGIELYPEERRMIMEAVATVRNMDNVAIDSLHLMLGDDEHFTLEIPNVELVLHDDELDHFIYVLKRPLAPGEEMEFTVKGNYAATGIENEISFIQLVNNGTFFNNLDLIPTIGYTGSQELGDRNDRRKYGLPPKEPMAPLSEDPEKRKHNYLLHYSDQVTVSTTISTSGDQVAVAPGSLKKEWTSDGRNYFQYELDHPSLNFYSFLSARYEVARETWTSTIPGQGPVEMEVYYHAPHGVNVPRMLNSMRKSLDYYTKHFGPYRHKQVRILEFPRYFSFAQAFPGTMPYSESIGFITDLTAEEDIDMVFYVVAHEMGHQWWAHQVIGADMQGATLLSESMAQYSALMVMEKEYGRDHMRKFLKLENDNYLRARGSEHQRELPLLRVENQGYVHYNKGSVVLYCLREFLGEDTLNSAFRAVIDSFAYGKPPYPTSLDLYRELRAVTPDSLVHLLEDHLEYITLYDNRLTSATGKKLADGTYEVRLELTCQKNRADTLGRETAVPLNDLMDVALLREAEDDEDEGAVLTVRRVRLKEGKNTVVLRSSQAPAKAIIDPMHLFFDRVPDDNAKKVEMNE